MTTIVCSPRYFVLYYLLLAQFLYERVIAFIAKPSVRQYCRNVQEPLHFTSTTMQYEIGSSHVVDTIRTIPLQSQLPVLPSSLLAIELNGTITNVLIALFAAIAIYFIVVPLFVVPAAAKLYEDTAKKLSPELWEEYERQLLSGETLSMRPDLMAELGNKVLALQNGQFDEDEWELIEETETDTSDSETSTAPVVAEAGPDTNASSPSTKSLIDTEMTSKGKWDD
jgi:hypothetical protein